MAQKTIFKAYTATSPRGKNNHLAKLLLTPWNRLDIVKITRIENDSQKGWLATYKD